MFIESGSALVNCSPLAGDLQLTGVRVLFNKFCGAPPMIVGTWSMAVVLGWSIIMIREQRKLYSANFLDIQILSIMHVHSVYT